MTLTAAFESYEDMMSFARSLAGNTNTAPVVQKAAEEVLGLSQLAAQQPVTSPTQPRAYTTPVQPPVYTAPVTPPVTAAPVVPTATTSYTMEDLTKAAIPLMDSGKQPALLQLLKDFGVEALPSLAPGQYGAFATALRGLGAQI